MDTVLEYHITQTDKNFDEVKADLQDMKLKLEELRDFKIQMLASSKTVSLIISTIFGILSLVATLLINIKYH